MWFLNSILLPTIVAVISARSISIYSFKQTRRVSAADRALDELSVIQRKAVTYWTLDSRVEPLEGELKSSIALFRMLLARVDDKQVFKLRESASKLNILVTGGAFETMDRKRDPQLVIEINSMCHDLHREVEDALANLVHWCPSLQRKLREFFKLRP